jgi:hypothetical protein
MALETLDQHDCGDDRRQQILIAQRKNPCRGISTHGRRADLAVPEGRGSLCSVSTIRLELR